MKNVASPTRADGEYDKYPTLCLSNYYNTVIIACHTLTVYDSLPASEAASKHNLEKEKERQERNKKATQTKVLFFEIYVV